MTVNRQQVNRPVDPVIPGYIYSYDAEIPDDGSGHSLAELDLGYFTVADDPLGSDRPIRAVEIRVDSETDPTDILYIGGPHGQTYPLMFGESFGLTTARLSDLWVRASISSAAEFILVHVLFLAMDE